MTETVQGAGSGAGRPARQDVGPAAAAMRDLLRAELMRGCYDEHALPDEAALQRAFGASRGAVRAALELLRSEGLIERMRGAGTFIAAQKTLHRTGGLQGLGHQRGPVVHEVLLRQRLGAPRILANLLRVEAGSPVLRIDRRTKVGGEVVGLWTGYLPLPVADRLAEPGADLSGDFYDALERLLGREIAYSDVTSEAVLADPVVAPTLGIPVGAPVLRLERVVYLGGGEPVEFGVGRFRGDRLSLSTTRQRR